jgi:type I restriction enzyme M protein
VKKREFKLDGFKWLKEESANDADELPEPEDLAAEAMAELKDVIGELEQVLKLLVKAEAV